MKYPFRNQNLTFKERINDLLSRLTIDEKLNMLSTHHLSVERLGVGEWYIGSEVARGYVSRKPEEPTTVFPQPIGMAGMFDPPLMKRLGEAAGIEARIMNKRHQNSHLMLWGPTVDACRDPRWGRNEEAYGEDPFLTGKMTIEYTKGLAGEDEKYLRTIPTLKHFYANNNEVGRISGNSNIEPRTKHEYYHEFFRPSIEEGGAYSMMAAYNELSGVPGMVNPDLQTIAKDEWGLGFVVTDGGDFTQNVMNHRYSNTHAETVALAIKAGTDVMTDDADIVYAAAKDALRLGFITEKDVDKALFNSLGGRFRLGEFDETHPYYDVDMTLMDCEAHKKLNHTAALEQVVLLKNDGLLPLEKGKTVAIVGDVGDKNYMDWYTGYSSYNISIVDGFKNAVGEKNVSFDDGHDHIAIRSKKNGKLLTADKDGSLFANSEISDDNSTFVKADWDGEVTYTLKSNGRFFTTETMKADSDTTFRWFSQEILRPRAYGEYIKYETYFKNKYLGLDEENKIVQLSKPRTTDEKLFSEEIVSDGIKRAVELAKKADVAVVCVGNNPMIVAREGMDRTTLSLPPHQAELIKAVQAVNKNVVVVVVSSYPYAINEENKTIPSIIYTTHAGPELGSALAEVVFGDYNPSGRLAQTWYTHEDELPEINDYDIIQNNSTYLYYEGKPLYPFGYGLSYSHFEYSGLSICRKENGTEISFDVKNTSETDGFEIPQIYFHIKNPRVKRPLKQLCGFERISIKAQEKKHINIFVSDKNLRFYDVTREKFCVESGEYDFMIGASCEDIRLSETLFIEGEKIPPRDLTAPTLSINYDEKGGTKMLFAKNENRHYMSGGELVFKATEFSGEENLQIYYATMIRHGKITVLCDNEIICEEKIPPTASPTGFKWISLKIKPQNGIYDLKLRLSDVNLVEFKMY